MRPRCALKKCTRYTDLCAKYTHQVPPQDGHACDALAFAVCQVPPQDGQAQAAEVRAMPDLALCMDFLFQFRDVLRCAVVLLLSQ